jgi:hypothetical protein
MKSQTLMSADNKNQFLIKKTPEPKSRPIPTVVGLPTVAAAACSSKSDRRRGGGRRRGTNRRIDMQDRDGIQPHKLT